MNRSEIFLKANELREKGDQFVMVTVVETEGSGPSVTGGRLILTTEKEVFGTVGGGSLEKLALKVAENIMISGTSTLKKYILDKDRVLPDSENTGMLCGGEVTLFYEFFGTGDKLYIFGAGHIGKELHLIMNKLDFSVSLIDDRVNVLASINRGNKVHFNQPEEIFEMIRKLDNSYMVIATHSHELDYKILKIIVEKGFVPRYLAVVASEKKIGTMMSRLNSELKDPVDADFLFSPAGLDIGGRSPAEIALSISAEIQAVRYKKEGLKHLSKL